MSWMSYEAAQVDYDAFGPDRSDYEDGPPDCDGSGEIEFVCDSNHAGPNCACRSVLCLGCENCDPENDD